jgi:hypothetical protein
LKGQRYVFLFSERPSEFAKPPSKNPQNAKEEYTLKGSDQVEHDCVYSGIRLLVLEGIFAQTSETQCIFLCGYYSFNGKFVRTFRRNILPQCVWIGFRKLYGVITQKTVVFSIARRQSLESYFVICTTGYSEILVTIYQITRCPIPLFTIVHVSVSQP